MLDMVGEDKITAYLAPPTSGLLRQETGRSVADIFAEHGIALTKTSNDRLDGWMAMHERLHVFEDEHGWPVAKLRISSLCFNLIRTLPQLRYDDKRVNDVATEPARAHARGGRDPRLLRVLDAGGTHTGGPRSDEMDQRHAGGLPGARLPRKNVFWSSAGGRPADKEDA